VKNERWEKIESIFHAARELADDERSRFLNEACSGDQAMRQEIEVLLRQDQEDESFLKAPAVEFAAALLPGADLHSGTKIGPYEVLGNIGAGGMGRVYSARDSRLDRLVAIKFISRDLADESARRRFQQEARMASALNHPHILTVLEAGEFEGQQYIVTEYVDGGTLEEWARDSKPGWRQIAELLIGVADALACAHDAGILHRDVKPANILLTKSGYAKLADFGLAKLAPTASTSPSVALTRGHTQSGVILGTISYMSPEQASGREVDARTDVFSFGVVLYEMLAGRRPFEGSTDIERLAAIIHVPAPSLAESCPGIPDALRAVVDKSLQKDPQHRYQSMHDLVNDLRAVTRQSDERPLSVSEAKRSVSTRQVMSWTALAIGIIAIAAAIYWTLVLRKPNAPVSLRIEALAVLPLKNVSGDRTQDDFAVGMTDAIIADLAQIESLRVISHTSVMQFKDTNKSLPEIARQLNVQGIIEGTLLRSGNRVEIRIDLIDSATESHLLSKQYVHDLGDILDLQNEIARSVANEIQAKLTPQEQGRLARSRKVNPDAWVAYLQGRHYLDGGNEQSLMKSIEYFQQAIKLDPNYAEAHAEVAEAWMRLEGVGVVTHQQAEAEALVAATKALELDDNIPESHVSMAAIRFQGWNWDAAEKEILRAIQINPGSFLAHSVYINQLRHRGRFGDSIAEAKLALTLDPVSAFAYENLGDAYMSDRQYDLAIEQYQKAIELNSDQAVSHDSLGWCYVYKGMYEKGIEEIHKSDGEGSDPSLSPEIAYVYAVSGDRKRAQKTLELLQGLSHQGFVPAHHFVLIYAGLGDKDKAFEWLEKAYEQHSPMMGWLKVDRRFDGLREDARFQRLLARVNLAN
jgi:serine/threonine protein kinase/Tfp pilus assembly protein PilF